MVSIAPTILSSVGVSLAYSPAFVLRIRWRIAASCSSDDSPPKSTSRAASCSSADRTLTAEFVRNDGGFQIAATLADRPNVNASGDVLGLAGHMIPKPLKCASLLTRRDLPDDVSALNDHETPLRQAVGLVDWLCRRCRSRTTEGVAQRDGLRRGSRLRGRRAAGSFLEAGCSVGAADSGTSIRATVRWRSLIVLRSVGTPTVSFSRKRAVRRVDRSLC